MKVIQVSNLTQTIKKLKKEGYWIVGAEANESSDYREIDYNTPLVVVMGSEGKGISRLILENCDFKVRIPLLGSVNSLNVSVATAIILYEVHNKKISHLRGILMKQVSDEELIYLIREKNQSAITLLF